MSSHGFNFREELLRPTLTGRTISPIPTSSVLEIDLATDRGEAALLARSPTLPDPHCSSLLLPAAAFAEAPDTDRATIAQLTAEVSPRRVLEEEKCLSMAATRRLQSEMQQLKAQLRRLESDSQSTPANDALQRIHRLEVENRELRERLERTIREKRAAEARCGELLEERKSIARQLAHTDEAASLLQGELSLSSIEALQREVADLRTSNASLREKEVRLSDELMSAKEHIKMLELDLMQTESACVAQTRHKDEALQQARAREAGLVQTTSHELRQVAAKLFDPQKLHTQLLALQRQKDECLSALSQSGDKRVRAALELQLVLLEGSITTASQRLQRIP